MLQGVAGCCRVLQGVAGCCRVGTPGIGSGGGGNTAPHSEPRGAGSSSSVRGATRPSAGPSEEAGLPSCGATLHLLTGVRTPRSSRSKLAWVLRCTQQSRRLRPGLRVRTAGSHHALSAALTAGIAGIASCGATTFAADCQHAAETGFTSECTVSSGSACRQRSASSTDLQEQHSRDWAPLVHRVAAAYEQGGIHTMYRVSTEWRPSAART